MDRYGEHARLRWQCRRGMLELDQLLSTFLEQGYERLSGEHKVLFHRLLEEDDTRLYEWFFQHPEGAPPDYESVVALIRSASCKTDCY